MASRFGHYALVSASADMTDDLLRRFRETLVEMDSGRVEAGGDSRKWNQLVDRLQSLHLRLRESPEGRAGITSLMSDDIDTVRQWSAAMALAWDELMARAELARQANGQGLVAMEAEITLREFDAGRLNMTWEPKGSRP
jgi:hypothetical protein